MNGYGAVDDARKRMLDGHENYSAEVWRERAQEQAHRASQAESEVERLREVCRDWGSNYDSWVAATREAEAEVADLRDRLAAVETLIEWWEAPGSGHLRCGSAKELRATLGDADTLAEVRARAWDEGHNDTDEHGDGNCECPNPYRADRNEGATDER